MKFSATEAQGSEQSGLLSSLLTVSLSLSELTAFLEFYFYFPVFLRRPYICTMKHVPISLLSSPLNPTLPPTTCPSSKFMSVFDSPLSPVGVAHVCVGVGTPTGA